MQKSTNTKSSNKKESNQQDGATAPAALPSSFKKFRQLPEIEAFYRFVYENDLRKEAKQIINKILLTRRAQKSASKMKARKKATTVN